MKPSAYVIALLLVLSGCASLQPAPNLLPGSAPKQRPVPAWILEPEPSLTPLLDKLISPYATESTESTPSLPPAKTN